MTSIYSSEYNDFLILLKKARLEARLTQLEAAKKFNKPQSFISKCESGERRVDIVEAMHFAAIYNKSISYFTGKIVLPNS